MNKFTSFALVLFASVAIVCAAPYGPPAATYGQPPSGPAVQQVDYASLNLGGINLDPYLGGSAPAPANYGNKQIVSGYLPVSNVAAAPAPSAYNAPASASSYNAPAASAYNAPAPSYGAQAPSYGAPAAPSYPPINFNSPPKYSAQPAYATDIYAGQSNYQAYQSPPSYSRVALPVSASDAVAKLFIPQKQASYGAPSNSYNAGY